MMASERLSCGCTPSEDPSFPYYLPEGFTLLPKPNLKTCNHEGCGMLARIRREWIREDHHFWRNGEAAYFVQDLCRSHARDAIFRCCDEERFRETFLLGMRSEIRD